MGSSPYGEAASGVTSNATYMARVRTELALERAEEELRKANAKISNLKLEVASMTGRTVAIKVGSEEATRRGASWDVRDVRRFTAAAKGAPDFTSEVLRELLDRSMAAVTRRVDSALSEAQRACADSEKAEVDGEASMEEAFAKCTGLTAAAEHTVRQAARGVLVGAARRTTKLRNALKKLEAEVRSAQSVQASDARCMAAQLIAQRDAVAALLAHEMERMETEGSESIRGLMATRSELKAALAARDAENARLSEELSEARWLHREEKRGRKHDNALLRLLTAELAHADGAYYQLQEERGTHSRALAVDLRLEEQARATEREHHEQVRRSAAAEASAMADTYEHKLKAMRRDARASLETTHRRVVELEMEMRDNSAHLANKLHELEAGHQKERSFLQKKSKKLGTKVLELQATTSRGRAMLYWASMKKASTKVDGGASSGHGRALRDRYGLGDEEAAESVLFADDDEMEAEFARVRMGLA